MGDPRRLRRSRSLGHRRRQACAVELSLRLLPFAGIAFLWFIGVIRDRLGEGEDRLFATVFQGSGLLFVAMSFASASVAAGLLSAADTSADVGSVWPFGERTATMLAVDYGMRMAAVFTISATTLAARLHIVPRWLAMFGYATAAALLLGLGLVPGSSSRSRSGCSCSASTSSSSSSATHRSRRAPDDRAYAYVRTSSSTARASGPVPRAMCRPERYGVRQPGTAPHPSPR